MKFESYAISEIKSVWLWNTRTRLFVQSVR
jgi:hypothetical protein